MVANGNGLRVGITATVVADREVAGDGERADGERAGAARVVDGDGVGLAGAKLDLTEVEVGVGDELVARDAGAGGMQRHREGQRTRLRWLLRACEV